ncbi:hypothetical protein M9H77_26612 [Catharanthus roseus]|uniref:Uncharacterized protein n=1 Tax=Catharanthus roseus TaxID=4058 RepID=A0ACC0AAI7_CATRO|nr:hypothetical protein M9H77_26612 [Catharanthus roseus]
MFDDAWRILGEMDKRDTITYTSLATRQNQLGFNEMALSIINHMHNDDIEMDWYTFSYFLSASASSSVKQQGQMAFLFTNTYEKPHSDQGVNSGHDLVFGSVRELHCTWLVPHTRASSDGIDVSDSGEWIYLKRGIDRGGCGPISLCGHHIMLCGGIRPPSGESGGARN